MTIRLARVGDVPAIGGIISEAAELGLMLPKSWSQLYERVRGFVVAVDAEEKVVGVCGLSVIWADLAEVVSLAVEPAWRGRGLGRRLVEVVLEEARGLSIRRVMTLTYEQAFFEKLGFEVLDRRELPLKVWADCVQCSKHEACDEIAMVRVFEDVPEPVLPPVLPSTDFAPPVVLTHLTREGGGIITDG